MTTPHEEAEAEPTMQDYWRERCLASEADARARCEALASERDRALADLRASQAAQVLIDLAGVDAFREAWKANAKAVDEVVRLLAELERMTRLANDASHVMREMRVAWDAAIEQRDAARRERDEAITEAEAHNVAATQYEQDIQRITQSLADAGIATMELRARLAALEAALPTDEERLSFASCIHVTATCQDAIRVHADRCRPWLARLDAARNGGG